MIDEGYAKSTPPIVLTKVHPDPINVPRDDFKVTAKVVDNEFYAEPYCLRYVEQNGKSYAVTYWNCPKELDTDDPYQWSYIYKCSECEMVTWVDIDV